MWLGNRFRILILLIVDAVLAMVSGTTAAYARFDDAGWQRLGAQHAGWKLALLVSITLVSNYFFDFYDLSAYADRLRQRYGLLLSIAQSFTLSALLLALVSYAAPQFYVGRGVVALSLALLALLMFGWRWLAGWLLKRKMLAERVLILGTDSNAIAVAREALQRREKGYEVVGFIGNDPALVGRSLINPCVLGVTADMSAVVKQRRVNRIVVASDEGLALDPLLGLKLSEQLAVEDSAAFYERLTGKIDLERLSPRNLVFANLPWGTRFYGRLRDFVNMLLAAVGLVLSAPLMLMAMVAIKLDSRGPVFYSQDRVGQFGKLFRILKLRSMCTDAERHGPVWAAKADARVTRVGRWLRKTRIDELPQFINVLRGEMSFIGPRPERPEFVSVLEQAIPFYHQRHFVKPGVTGWAQVRAPYCASLEEAKVRHQYDLYYIKNQSPTLDALILLETVRVVCRGKLGR